MNGWRYNCHTYIEIILNINSLTRSINKTNEQLSHLLGNSEFDGKPVALKQYIDGVDID